MSLAYPRATQFVDQAESAAELKAAQHGAAEDFEDLHLFGSERAWGAVDDAEGAQPLAVAAEGHSAVEADIGIAGYQRILGKPGIFFRIRDDERFGMFHRVRAE